MPGYGLSLNDRAPASSITAKTLTAPSALTAFAATGCGEAAIGPTCRSLLAADRFEVARSGSSPAEIYLADLTP